MRELDHPLTLHALPGQSIVAMFHEQLLAIQRERLAIAEVELAFADFYPGFNHQLVVHPLRRSA